MENRFVPRSQHRQLDPTSRSQKFVLLVGRPDLHLRDMRQIVRLTSPPQEQFARYPRPLNRIHDEWEPEVNDGITE